MLVKASQHKIAQDMSHCSNDHLKGNGYRALQQVVHLQTGAAVLGVPVKPTIKEVDSSGMVVKTLVRACLWEVQTPQVCAQHPAGQAAYCTCASLHTPPV